MIWAFDTIKCLLETTQKYGIWNLLTFLVTLSGLALAFRYLFYSKKNIKNLDYSIYPDSDNSNYPLKIIIEIANYTGKSVIIKDAYVILNKFKPDPNANVDKTTRQIKIRFKSPNIDDLREIDYLLRHKEGTKTWIHLDPNQTIEEIKKEIINMKTGRLYATYIWISDNPKIQKLKRSF